MLDSFKTGRARAATANRTCNTAASTLIPLGWFSFAERRWVSGAGCEVMIFFVPGSRVVAQPSERGCRAG